MLLVYYPSVDPWQVTLVLIVCKHVCDLMGGSIELVGFAMRKLSGSKHFFDLVSFALALVISFRFLQLFDKSVVSQVQRWMWFEFGFICLELVIKHAVRCVIWLKTEDIGDHYLRSHPREKEV